jgi:hypothetical protein
MANIPLGAIRPRRTARLGGHKARELSFVEMRRKQKILSAFMEIYGLYSSLDLSYHATTGPVGAGVYSCSSASKL